MYTTLWIPYFHQKRTDVFLHVAPIKITIITTAHTIPTNDAVCSSEKYDPVKTGGA